MLNYKKNITNTININYMAIQLENIYHFFKYINNIYFMHLKQQKNLNNQNNKIKMFKKYAENACSNIK